MNRPPEDFVLVKEERLLDFSTACFQKAGLDADHAALISRFLVNSDLRGVRTHGTAAMNGYCQIFEAGTQNPQPTISVLSETPTTAVVDGDGTLGYSPMAKATELAIAKAKEFGIRHGHRPQHRPLRFGRPLRPHVHGAGVRRFFGAGVSRAG